MIFIVYQILASISFLIVSPFLLIKAIFGGHGIKERLGLWDFKPDGRKTVWIHAASVGELKIISTIFPEFLKSTNDYRIVISTITKTGKTKARGLPFQFETYYSPIDMKFIVNKVIKKIKPALLVLVETELWPVMLNQVKKSGAGITIVNGRLSVKSYRLYKMASPLCREMLRKIDYIMTQTGDDAQRFINLGASPQNVEVFGNTKFDQILVADEKPVAGELSRFLSDQDDFIFIAGSVRKGEFHIIADTLKTAFKENANLKAIVAPRHLKELNELETVMQYAGLAYARRTRLTKESEIDKNILILDTMGELAGFYKYAGLAFVGGSLVKIGGHDPLEPASGGCAVCFGPHMDNSRYVADMLVEAGGAFYINNKEELAVLIKRLASDKNKAKSIGALARGVLISNSGVSRKIAEKLLEFL